MPRRVSLIVNPSAGNGRAARLLPRVEAACAVVAAGAQRRVDVGDVDGRSFIGVASVGCDSEANRIANQTRVVRGNVVYAYGALRALATWTPARFTLDLDGGRRITFPGYSVAAANSRAYGGGMFIAPDAELDDGMLNVVCSGQATKRRALLNLTRVFQGRHVEAPWVHVLRSREVTVSCDRPFTMYADGDPIGDLPLTVRARHRALQVIVPE